MSFLALLLFCLVMVAMCLYFLAWMEKASRINGMTPHDRAVYELNKEKEKS